MTYTAGGDQDVLTFLLVSSHLVSFYIHSVSKVQCLVNTQTQYLSLTNIAGAVNATFF